MKSILPIVVPGTGPISTRTVEVPCRLPESFDFRVFLPSRGVRTFTCWLTSVDPLKAEVKDVQLSNREGDPRAGLAYEVDADEQQRADEAGGDVLDAVLGMLGLIPATRRPLPLVARPGSRASALHAIALALSAQEDFESRCASMGIALRKAGLADADRDAWELVHEGDEDESPACVAMRGYVEHVLDAACCAQADKADRQLAEHPASDEDDPGSERIRAPRSLDVATLKCLDVEY